MWPGSPMRSSWALGEVAVDRAVVKVAAAAAAAVRFRITKKHISLSAQITQLLELAEPPQLVAAGLARTRLLVVF
jgi:hypothetical protein